MLYTSRVLLLENVGLSICSPGFYFLNSWSMRIFFKGLSNKTSVDYSSSEWQFLKHSHIWFYNVKINLVINDIIRALPWKERRGGRPRFTGRYFQAGRVFSVRPPLGVACQLRSTHYYPPKYLSLHDTRRLVTLNHFWFHRWMNLDTINALEFCLISSYRKQSWVVSSTWDLRRKTCSSKPSTCVSFPHSHNCFVTLLGAAYKEKYLAEEFRFINEVSVHIWRENVTGEMKPF